MRAGSRVLLTAVLRSLLLIGSFGIRAHAFTNGQMASLVIGQKDFTSNMPTASRNGQSDNGGEAFDSSGNLWLADFSNNRVLEFKPPFSSGMDASLVIGQPDFTSSSPATSQYGLNRPDGPAFDLAGNLWVADGSSNRILEFSSTPVPEFPTASLAIIALVSMAVVTIALRRFPMRPDGR